MGEGWLMFFVISFLLPYFCGAEFFEEVELLFRIDCGGGGVLFFLPKSQVVFTQSRGRKCEKGGGSVIWLPGRGRGGVKKGAFPNPSWDGGEGWEEAVHMRSCVTYDTKEHFMLFKRALAYLTVRIVWGVGWVVAGTEGEGGTSGWTWWEWD